MKKATTKKAKAPVKPKHCIVHLRFESVEELQFLDELRKLTGTSVATKAINEALVNYPKYLKRSDGLNDELKKVNREFENLINKFDTVKRAFSIMNDTNAKPSDEESDEVHTHDWDSLCSECSNDKFDEDGDCTECGNNKNN